MRNAFYLFFLLFNCIFTEVYSQSGNNIEFLIIDYEFNDSDPAKICFDNTQSYLESKGMASDSSGVKAFLKENFFRIIAGGEKCIFEQLFSIERYYEESRAFLKWTETDINKPYYFLQGLSNFADTYYISGNHTAKCNGWGRMTEMFPLDYLYFKRYQYFPYIDYRSITSYNHEVENYLAFVKELQPNHSPYFEELKSNLMASFRNEFDSTDFRSRTLEDYSDGAFKETVFNSMKKGNHIVCALKQSTFMNNIPEHRTENTSVTYYSNKSLIKKSSREKLTTDNFKTEIKDFTEVEFDSNLLPGVVSSKLNYSDIQNPFNDDFYGFDCWGYTLKYENGYLDGISYIYGYINNKSIYFTVEYKQQHKTDGSEVFYNEDGTENDQLNYCARAKEVFLKARDALQNGKSNYKEIAGMFKEGFALCDKITDKTVPLNNAREAYTDKDSSAFSLILPPKGFMEKCVKKGYISGW